MNRISERGHLGTALDVMKRRKLKEPDEAFCKDIRWFFSFPVPQAVWKSAASRQMVRFSLGMENTVNDVDAAIAAAQRAVNALRS